MSGDSEDLRGAEKRCKSMNFIGGRGRNRTYNLSVKSGPVRAGVRLFSSEYSGRFRQIWSPFDTLFGEEFDEEISIRFSRILIRFEYSASYRMVELAPNRF